MDKARFGLLSVLSLTLIACTKDASPAQDLSSTSDLLGATSDATSSADLINLDSGPGPGDLAAPDLVAATQPDLFPDNTAPTVLSITPAAAAMGVDGAQAITIVFSEPLAPATVTPQSVHVSEGPSVALSYAPGSTMVTLTPSTAIAAGTPVVVTVETSVTDVAGNPIAARYQSYFVTAAPTETRIDQGGALGIERAGQAFDENGNGLTVWMRRDPADGNLFVLYRALFDKSTTTWTAPEKLGTVDASWPTPQLLVVSADTKLLALVGDGGSSARRLTAYTHECQSTGGPCTWVSSADVLNTATQASTTERIAAGGRTGRFVASWRTSDSKLLARVYEASAWGSTVELSTSASDEAPVVAANKDLLAVGWRESTSLKVSTYRSSTFVAQTAITETGSNLRLTGGINTNGDLWLSYLVSTSGKVQLFARRHYLDLSSVPQWEAATQVSATTTNVAAYDVVARGSGGLATAWVEGNNSAGAVKARRYETAAWQTIDDITTVADANSQGVWLAAVGQDLGLAYRIQAGAWVASYADNTKTWTQATDPFFTIGAASLGSVSIAGRPGVFVVGYDLLAPGADTISLVIADVAAKTFTNQTLATAQYQARQYGVLRDGAFVHALYSLDGSLVRKRSPNFAVGTVQSSATDNPAGAGMLRMVSNGLGDSLLLFSESFADTTAVFAQRLDRGVPDGAPTKLFVGTPYVEAAPIGDGYLIVYYDSVLHKCRAIALDGAGGVGAATDLTSDCRQSFAVVGSGGKGYALLENSASSSKFSVYRWDGTSTKLGEITVSNSNPSVWQLGLASQGGDARFVYESGGKAYVVAPSGDLLGSPVELGTSPADPSDFAASALALGGRYYYAWRSQTVPSRCAGRIEASASLGTEEILVPDDAYSDGCRLTAGPNRVAAQYREGSTLKARVHDGSAWSAPITLGDYDFAHWALLDPIAPAWPFLYGTDTSVSTLLVAGLVPGSPMALLTTTSGQDIEAQLAMGGRQAALIYSLSDNVSTTLAEQRFIDGLLLPVLVLDADAGSRAYVSGVWDGYGVATVSSHGVGGQPTFLWATGWR